MNAPFNPADIRAYTGPYPIRTHRNLAEVELADLRIEQDNVDTAAARAKLAEIRDQFRAVNEAKRPYRQPRDSLARASAMALLIGAVILLWAVLIKLVGG